MHIALEAVRLVNEKRGIGRYVRSILRALPDVDPNVRFTLYANKLDRQPLSKQVALLGDAVVQRTTIAPIGGIGSANADVMWYAWNWIMHPTRTAPMVVTMLDLVPMLRFDHRWWKYLKRAKARNRSMRSARLASRILTISEFTTQEITRLLGVPRDRMRVTLLAADDFDTTPLPHSETLDQLGIDGPFFLAVGAQEARKNLITLFRAMERLHAEGVQAPLVLCGPGGPLEGLAKRHEAPWLRYAGYVSDAELATLYSRTTALVFPSRYEGFGLPVLEAMASGAPVITSNASSLPEVAGNAALYFDPLDDNALASQMRRLLHEPALRQQLLKAMPAQVAKFSWRRCAEETLLGFREAVEGPRAQR